VLGVPGNHAGLLGVLDLLYGRAQHAQPGRLTSPARLSGVLGVQGVPVGVCESPPEDFKKIWQTRSGKISAGPAVETSHPRSPSSWQKPKQFQGEGRTIFPMLSGETPPRPVRPQHVPRHAQCAHSARSHLHARTPSTPTGTCLACSMGVLCSS
jgi:hypothetical protein